LAHALGCIHEQKWLLGMLMEMVCYSRDWHQLSGVPEQVGQHHHFGAWL
jgi:hypothetical protein